MAARDLSAVMVAPLISRFDEALGTTWQEVLIPSWCDRVTVYADDALYLGWYGHDGASAEIPTDGGAVGAHRVELDAGGSYELTINPPPKLQRAGLSDITAVYVAGQHGVANSATLILSAGGS